MSKKFDSNPINGIYELVLDFALHATLFVGTVTTSNYLLLQQAPFSL